MYDTGIQRVSLNVGGKRNSGGIRDDESILCPTPPNREVTGYDLAHDPGVKFLQPINFTVNVNNAGPPTHGLMQPYFGTDFDREKEVEEYNQMMMNKLNKLPQRDAKNAQSLVPQKRRSSKRAEPRDEDGPYIDPEGTGNFNDDSSGADQDQQGGKA